MPLTPLLSKYDNVLLDLDGCVWLGDAVTRGAPQAISELPWPTWRVGERSSAPGQ
jgi:ribonucleotide monophosphatase NagD (HAD superfamily)